MKIFRRSYYRHLLGNAFVLFFCAACFVVSLQIRSIFQESKLTLPADTLWRADQEFQDARKAIVFTAIEKARDGYKDVKRDRIPTHTNAPMNIRTSNIFMCRDEKVVDIMIYIQSHWENFTKRRSLRNTWAGSKTFTDIVVRTIFILGLPLDAEDQMKINNEQLAYGDIVQGNFVDSFQNLTKKSILAFDWISTYCPNSRFVLKADDDMFINILSVAENVLPMLSKSRKSIACAIKPDGSSPIVRNKNSKWFIPEHVFKNKTHLPRFCTGYTVFMTSQLVKELQATPHNNTYISVDDVFMFGLLLTSHRDVAVFDMSKNFTLSYAQGEQDYASSDKQRFIAVASSTARDMDNMWSLALIKMSHWAKKHTSVIKSLR